MKEFQYALVIYNHYEEYDELASVSLVSESEAEHFLTTKPYCMVTVLDCDKDKAEELINLAESVGYDEKDVYEFCKENNIQHTRVCSKFEDHAGFESNHQLHPDHFETFDTLIFC